MSIWTNINTIHNIIKYTDIYTLAQVFKKSGKNYTHVNDFSDSSSKKSI